MKRGLIGLALCALVGACAQTMVSTPVLRPGEVSENLDYALPEAYYTLSVKGSRYDLVMTVTGPHIRASNKRFQFDETAAESASVDVRFDVDRVTGLAQRVLVSSDSRNDQIAAALGRALGAVAGATTNLPDGAAEELQAAEAETKREEAAPPVQYTELVRENVGVGDALPPSVQRAINAWFATVCGPTACERSQPPQVSFVQENVDFWRAQAAPASAAQCAVNVCFARTQRADFDLSVIQSGAVNAVPDDQIDVRRSAPIVDQTIALQAQIPNPDNVGLLDLRMGPISDGVAHVQFVEGGPTQAAFIETSSVEAGLLAPFNFVAGVLSTAVAVIPLRLVIDVQRNQADQVRGENATTFQPVTGAAITAIAAAGAAPSDILKTFAELNGNEIRATETVTMVLMRRTQGPPEQARNAANANGQNEEEDEQAPPPRRNRNPVPRR